MLLFPSRESINDQAEMFSHFGRIFAISDGVRAYFAPGPCAFARRGATREKNSARIALLRVLWTSKTASLYSIHIAP